MSTFNKIEQWAHDRNIIEGATRHAQFMKLTEELGEVAACLAKNKPVEELEAELGDMLVVITILAAQSGLNTEQCAAAAYDKIKDRKGKMINGVFVKEADL